MPRFRRILLKLSGEVLAGEKHSGLDFGVIQDFAENLAKIRDGGFELSLVIGGGNMLRGRDALDYGLDRVSVDSIGMLGTVMNALAVKAALANINIPAQVLSAVGMPPIADLYNRERARDFLSSGHVVIFAAGTGNPFFTTDTAAALRGAEIGAELVLKATKVDGVYTADPEKDPTATKFNEITYKEVLARGLKVMDLTAICMCQDNNLPIYVFNMDIVGNLKKVMAGEDIGTLVHP